MPTMSPRCTLAGSQGNRVSSHRIGSPKDPGVAAASTKSQRGVMTAVPKDVSLGLTRCTLIGVLIGPSLYKIRNANQELKGDLHAQGRQVVAPRKIIDIRAQSSPVSFCLSAAVIPLNHHLIDAARAVHDLLHLRLCLQITRR